MSAVLDHRWTYIDHAFAIAPERKRFNDEFHKVRDALLEKQDVAKQLFQEV